MDETKRTKILGAILALVLGFMAIRPDKLLTKPIVDAQRDLDTAIDEYEREDLKQMEVMAAKERITHGRSVSLPPSISDAQRLYQSWITNLAEQCRFAQLAVTPGNTQNRPGQFLTVNVNLEAETDLDGLSRFLFLFEQAELMHRISSLDIQSTGSQGNPRLEITLTAEGMSVRDSPVKPDVFVRTLLSQPVTADATEITVAESADFPTTDEFLAQVGREMVKVLSVKGQTWTVERGQEGTKAAAHVPDEIVQLFPVPAMRKNVKFSDYETLLKSSPFIKPAPERVYKPRLVISDQTIAPGETVAITAKAEDLNTDVGPPVFALEDAVEGMTINPESGEFSWAPAADMEPKRYATTVVLSQRNNAELRVEKSVGITIALPNDPPQVVLPENAIVVLGRPFTLTAKAEDDGPADKLSFSLDGDVPSGLTVDSSGVLNWKPPVTLAPGDYSVTVKVTDGGTPALSGSATIALMVKDDTAELTRFTAAVGLDGVAVAWFWNQAENKRPELKVGDRIVAADIDAELTEIAKRHILMADAKGIWRLRLGENLRQRELIEPAAVEPTISEPAEVKPAEVESTVVEPVPPSEEAPVSAEDAEAEAPTVSAPADAPSTVAEGVKQSE